MEGWKAKSGERVKPPERGNNMCQVPGVRAWCVEKLHAVETWLGWNTKKWVLQLRR